MSSSLPGLKSYLAGFYRSKTHPLKVQEELLFDILEKNKETMYGFEHDFSSVSSLSKFQSLPIITYEDIRSHVDMIAKGAKNVLTKDDVVSFAVTSGSTSAAKLIPVTKLRKSTFFRELALYGFLHPSLMKDKMFYIAGPRKEKETLAHIPVGSISGYLVSLQPWVIRKRLVVPVEVYDILDSNKKFTELAFHALKDSSITHFSFSSAVELLFFFDFIEKNFSSLLTRLKKEGFSSRAKQLEKSDKTPASIWPKVRAFSCVLSASNRLYLPKLFERFGKDSLEVYDPGVLASEGRYTLTIRYEDGVPLGIPMVHNYVYEYAKQKKDGSFAKPVFVNKVKKNQKYKLIITSQEGLYRYDTDDIFEVVDFEDKLPVLRFVSRATCLNMAGELAAEENIVKAITVAKDAVGLDAPVLLLPWFKESEGKPCYDLHVGASPDEDLALKFAARFDEELSSLVYPYKRMRTFFARISFPRVTFVKAEGLQALQQERLSSSGQPKPLVVSPNESLREKLDILKVVEKK